MNILARAAKCKWYRIKKVIILVGIVAGVVPLMLLCSRKSDTPMAVLQPLEHQFGIRFPTNCFVERAASRKGRGVVRVARLEMNDAEFESWRTRCETNLSVNRYSAIPDAWLTNKFSWWTPPPIQADNTWNYEKHIRLGKDGITKHRFLWIRAYSATNRVFMFVYGMETGGD
jgi:hypothetical protein